MSEYEIKFNDLIVTPATDSKTLFALLSYTKRLLADHHIYDGNKPVCSVCMVAGYEFCHRDLIGKGCRCPACEVRKVEAAEAAQEASEGR